MAYGLLFHSGEAESGDSDEEVSIGGQDEDADSVEASQRLHGLDEVANLHHVPSEKAISAWNGLLAFKKKATSAKAKAFGPPILGHHRSRETCFDPSEFGPACIE